ncbi:aminotransferase class III-fold pyridoxal phosphate-dependent enzyme [Methylomonas sp. Kb3]|uniref:aminotransferase class III-fold pyridoxal phosphate-dependent enzyme n=1 Tax=Methylomonas sp. Kb3 TaxID=1611544 RepID=UPI0013FD4221|nr:aminotransferase class III-fold pyridoxal phosphate-dependent enzyme [Methylomonas sp. Kb3]
MRLLKTDFVYRNDPLVIAGASGCTLTERSGRKYIDLQASSGAAILGYDSSIMEMAALRAATLPSKPQFCESVTRLALTEKLDRMFRNASGCEGRIAYDLGGAQGIEHAIKVISAEKPNATCILAFDGAYHGRSLATSFLSSGSRYTSLPGPGLFKVVRLPVPALISASSGISLEEADEVCRQKVSLLFSDERYGVVGSTYALHSLVFEPILNVAGMHPFDESYISFVIEKIRSNGGHIIADEIFTGFYKDKGFLASASYSSMVDIVVISKGLTNGLAPLSVIWVNEESGLESAKPGLHSSTYINNEFSLCCALEVIERIELLNSNDLERPKSALEYIIGSLKRQDLVSMIHSNVGAIRFKNPDEVSDIYSRLMHTGAVGVVTASTGLAKDSIILHPALTLTDDEIEQAKEIMEVSLEEC